MKKGVDLIPSLCTTGNLLCGFFAIISAVNGRFLQASFAILAALIFDILDGRLARLTKTCSDFGVEYDSLADLISFGIAPALLAYSWGLNIYGRLGWVAAFLFVCCGALRLARFNTLVGESKTPRSKDFVGLPIPGAAALVASTFFFIKEYPFFEDFRSVFLILMVYLLSFLMVSNFRYRSFKQLDFRKKRPFNLLVMSVLVIFVVAAFPQLMLFLIFFSYSLSGLFEKGVHLLGFHHQRSLKNEK